MITISDALLPEYVVLDLTATTPDAAIEHMAGVLRKHPHMEDWELFHEVLKTNPLCVTGKQEYGVCIPHARTEGVSEMIMSAGRLATPLPFPGCEQPVRYVFCIGVPKAMVSDYLRIAGALMRVLSDPATDAALAAAKTRAEFVEALTSFETKL